MIKAMMFLFLVAFSVGAHAETIEALVKCPMSKYSSSFYKATVTQNENILFHDQAPKELCGDGEYDLDSLRSSFEDVLGSLISGYTESQAVRYNYNFGFSKTNFSVGQQLQFRCNNQLHNATVIGLTKQQFISLAFTDPNAEQSCGQGRYYRILSVFSQIKI